jgi:PAS domain S-box-containing protein
VTESERARLEERVLVLTPTPRDADLARSVLDRAGIASFCCSGLGQACSELERGAGAILLPEEAVLRDEKDQLSRWLARQPPWSDIPIIVLARPGADSATVGQAMDLLANVTVLERPTRVTALVSAVRTALRSRQRQYQTREHLSELERREHELRDFFDNAAVGIHWVDRGGIILRANQAELDMLGYEHAEYVGHPISEFHVRPETADEIMNRIALGERLDSFEARIKCKDGSVKDVLIDSSVWSEPDRFTHMRCFTRDVTDRKRAENALREADRRKDEFLAILAHELRNPLAPIRNSVHILRMTTRDDPTAERISELMERQVNHMVHLVDDLMEVSRITRGKIALRKERIEVAAVILSAVDTSRPLIESAGHRLELEIPPEPMTVEGDPVRLNQIFANLLNNAAKYTEDGGHIRLAVQQVGGEVEVSVEDNGAGIPPESLPRVFDLFAQGDRSAPGGLGIGLTLVRRLVEMHDGSVEAHSDGLGRGSRFVVRLPLALDQRPTAAVESAGRPSHALTPRRILVVDDNRDAASSLGMLLKLLGAEVHVVYNGPDALEALGTHRPDVVLLDIGMPGMDGHEVARQLRQRPECRDVTLIALTGWGQEEDRRRSRIAGFDYHLIKPADVSALQTLLVSLESHGPGGR